MHICAHRDASLPNTYSFSYTKPNKKPKGVRSGVIAGRILHLPLRLLSASRPDHFTPQEKGPVPFKICLTFIKRFYSHNLNKQFRRQHKV
jgi:hypothetical protein